MELFFKKYLTRTRNGRLAKLSNAKWLALLEDEWFEQWKFPKGSQFKCFETTNFGWVVFSPETKLANGSIPIKRIFRY